MADSNKKNLAKEASAQLLNENEEIKELAYHIFEASKSSSDDLNDVVDCYAQELKKKWSQDPASFGERLMQGYSAILEKIRSDGVKKNSETKAK